MTDILPDPPSAPTGEVEQRSVGAHFLLARTLRTLWSRLGIFVLSFAFAVVLARALDPSSRGDFALLQTLNGLTVVAANFAIAKAIVHHVGKGRISPRNAGGAAAVLAVLSGGVAALILIPVSLSLRGPLFSRITLPWIAGAILLATPLLVREYLGGVMIAIGRSEDYVKASAVQPLTGFIALAALLALQAASFHGVLGAWSAGILLSALLSIALARNYSRVWPPPQKQHLVALGRFGVRTYPAFLARFLNLRLDQFLVATLASSAALGQYAVAVNVAELLIRFPTIILWTLSGAISARDRDASGELVAQFVRWMMLLMALAVLTVGVAAPFGVPFIFGSQYRPAVSAVLLLLPGMFCYAPAEIIAEYFIVQRGRPGKAGVIAGLSVATGTGLNFVLIPSLGAVGASIASSISYAVMFGTGLVLFTRDTGRSLGSVLWVSASDVRSLLSGGRQALRRSERDEPAGAGEIDAMGT